jgi:hypothetical protein
LISWLTGSIAGAGITLPETFDLKGIFQLVMQILGLSFDQIMKRVADLLGFDIRTFIAPIMEIINIYKTDGMAGLAKFGLAKLIGQDRVDALMKVWEIFQVVMSGDFGKLWEMVQGYLSNLKEMVMGKIEEFLTERVIKAGLSRMAARSWPWSMRSSTPLATLPTVTSAARPSILKRPWPGASRWRLASCRRCWAWAMSARRSRKSSRACAGWLTRPWTPSSTPGR